ncbi:hypothetical protein HPB51_016869 [Rhipicephalus microplus]|uniref:Uncharacterized protein n=1 Tax=Rhipicephalus microplus TaxID=6941 RepID=A0A9J6DIQ0_RHIMP|nr:hypothetical protein HPB51_016869 [Rhipicephalus microplus]
MGIKEQIDDIRLLSEKNVKDIAITRVRLDDSEDRARRSNRVLFGFLDREHETWTESEASVLQFCIKELNTTIEHMEIERAHRLWKYRLNKSHPIVVRLAHFKTKDKVLPCAYKLKGSNYRISEDFSPNTLQARKHLAELGRAQRQSFRLRHDKLIVGSNTYTFLLHPGPNASTPEGTPSPSCAVSLQMRGHLEAAAIILPPTLFYIHLCLSEY